MRLQNVSPKQPDPKDKASSSSSGKRIGPFILSGVSLSKTNQIYILDAPWGPDKKKKTSMSKLFVTFLTKIDNVLHDPLVVTVCIHDADRLKNCPV